MRALEHARLRLEPQVEGHAAEMFAVLSDPAIYEHENAPPCSVAWLADRYRKLESRVSPDGTERWLNWVVRLPTGELAGYVQATVHASGRAAIAYELNSRYWGRGIASAAVERMIAELAAAYGVETLGAVLKQANARSRRLLERLGFAPAPEALRKEAEAGPDELLMVRSAAPGSNLTLP